MPSQPYDLAVAYRVYPRISKTPLAFANDKLKLVEVCLQSFKRSLGSLRTKVWVLLDGCPPQYEQLFRSLFATEDLVLVRLSGAGNFETFIRQVGLLAEQEAAELVYFAEDDYFYLPNALASMVEFLRAHSDAHFVSPYDHPDCYTLEMHRHAAWIKVYGGRHWRTAASTCMTFLTTRTNLRCTRHIFETYRRRNNDASVWFILTKQTTGLFNPFRLAHYGLSDIWTFKLLVKAWLFGWRHILFGRTWKLWAPIPSLGTHMESCSLAPGVAWTEEVAAIAVTPVENVPL